MKVLAFDTATENCTVALWADGAVHERAESGQRHGERILVLVEQVLGEAGLALRQLDAIGFGRGPGSFTGLRISAGVAQGLAFGADLPVVPVSSLRALAQGVEADKVAAAFDARMQQVYWGAYRRNSDGLMVLQGEESVIAPDEASLPPDSGWVGVGSGWDVYTDALRSRLADRVAGWRPNHRLSARFLAELAVADFKAGGAVSPEQAVPVYIRDNVAEKKSPT